MTKSSETLLPTTQAKRTSFFKKLSFPVAIFLGIYTGVYGSEFLLLVATTVSDSFIRLLKLISMPIIFFSLVATLSGMHQSRHIKRLAKTILSYTLLTTWLAAIIALTLFLFIEPVQTAMPSQLTSDIAELIPFRQGVLNMNHYFSALVNTIPENIFQPFHEGNVMSVLLLALLLSFAILSLPDTQRKPLHSVFSSFYSAIMKITEYIVKLMPFAIWAFVALFVKQTINESLPLQDLALYLTCIVLANLIQAFIVLPLFLRAKKIPVFQAMKAMFPALNLAFWSKSSSAALPVAIQCAENRLKLPPKLAQFSLPLCITINMNACAAFILITVFFVAQSHGIDFSVTEMVLWTGVATLAAIGNAGVPMGCFFLSSALLAFLDVPLHYLGVILPFYAMIDMLESAINVWSDSCVTLLASKKIPSSFE